MHPVITVAERTTVVANRTPRFVIAQSPYASGRLELSRLSTGRARRIFVETAGYSTFFEVPCIEPTSIRPIIIDSFQVQCI